MVGGKKRYAQWLGVRNCMLHGWEYEGACSMVGSMKGHDPWLGVRNGMLHGWE